MNRMNCWEFFSCGREHGGGRENELGVCLAAAAGELNGLNDGACGGRCCWAIAGTFCGGMVQGTYAQKLGDCLKCDFHTFVRHQQAKNYVKTRQILDVLARRINASSIRIGNRADLDDAG